MSDQLELRLFRESDIAVLEALTQDPETTGEHQWFGWHDLRRWRRGWADDGLIGPDGGTLVVARENHRLGLVNWRRRPTTPAAYCWEIGVIMLPHARGQHRRAAGTREGRVHPRRRDARNRMAQRLLAGRRPVQPAPHRSASLSAAASNRVAESQLTADCC